MTTAKLEDSAPTSHTDEHLIAGRYRTHTRIGHGRLGEIFAAIDERYEESGVEQHLAIQIIPDSVVRNNRLFNRLNLGYNVLRTGAHPNIVKFLHFGRYGKFGFLAMELLDGGPICTVLDDAKTLPLAEVLPVIREVGEALQLLHANDMVHGNLTTKNVFITKELEVRLLDVLPLDSAVGIVRGTAMSEPPSRYTVEDDVFGLACLAYRMLAGKHPFNDSPPAEARLTGLEADRIASLTDSEWNALRRALSLDREQQTSSIADFMRDLGITGTERLQPTADQPVRQPARHESFAQPAVEEAPPITQLAVPVQSTLTAAPVADVDSVSWDVNWPSNARPTSKGPRPLRAVLLGMLLAGVSTWFFYGQPQQQIANLISYIDESMTVGLTKRSDGIVEISTPEPDRSVSTDPVAPIDPPAAAAPAATVEASLADLEAKHSEPERAATIEEIDTAVAQPTDQPAPADPVQTQPELVLGESIVSVSERDGAARVTRPRVENSATRLFWWTSEHTAKFDEDFVPIKQQAIAGASIEGGNMLHIPLVDDGLPEPRETFFVNFGLRNNQQGPIELVATVRVDIIDDDLP